MKKFIVAAALCLSVPAVAQTPGPCEAQVSRTDTWGILAQFNASKIVYFTVRSWSIDIVGSFGWATYHPTDSPVTTATTNQWSSGGRNLGVDSTWRWIDPRVDATCTITVEMIGGIEVRTLTTLLTNPQGYASLIGVRNYETESDAECIDSGAGCSINPDDGSGGPGGGDGSGGGSGGGQWYWCTWIVYYSNSTGAELYRDLVGCTPM